MLLLKELKCEQVYRSLWVTARTVGLKSPRPIVRLFISASARIDRAELPVQRNRTLKDGIVDVLVSNGSIWVDHDGYRHQQPALSDLQQSARRHTFLRLQTLRNRHAAV